MTYTEKNTVVSLLTGMLVFGVYSFKMHQLYLEGRFDAADAGVLMGKSVLYMIAASIIIVIITSVIFSIIHAMATGEKTADFVVDERDKLIDLKAMQFSFIVFSFGFVGSAIALVFEVAPLMVIFATITSMFVASIAGDIFKLVCYRRGY
ncbi:MAG: hypothetical protein L3J33_13165 [Rhodobacteraceae bacterium]|nr:hypothetical protein [Paracoccaceae bacterium]